MIARAALAFGLAWLLVPHQPDLGLAAVPAPGDSARQAVFAQLRAVRREIAGQAIRPENPWWDVRWEAAVQNAGRLLGDAAPGPQLADGLAAAARLHP